jgi:hypothetical protein
MGEHWTQSGILLAWWLEGIYKAMEEDLSETRKYKKWEKPRKNKINETKKDYCN